MRQEMRRPFVRWAGVSALALALAGGFVGPCRAETAKGAKAAVADWPETSRITALALIEKYGTPRHASADSLTWVGPGNWKRTVLHRDDSAGGLLEQTVAYRVPEKKVADLQGLEGGVSVDRKREELTVRTDGERTNFLAANLAHEVASGFKTPDQARDFYGRQLRLANAGKSSSYLDSLRFGQKPRLPTSPFSPYRPDWPTPQSLPDGKYTPPY